ARGQREAPAGHGGEAGLVGDVMIGRQGADDRVRIAVRQVDRGQAERGGGVGAGWLAVAPSVVTAVAGYGSAGSSGSGVYVKVAPTEVKAMPSDSESLTPSSRGL